MNPAGVDAVEGAPDAVVTMRQRAPARIAQRYTWERVTDAYERLFDAVRVVAAGEALLAEDGEGRIEDLQRPLVGRAASVRFGESGCGHRFGASVEV